MPSPSSKPERSPASKKAALVAAPSSEHGGLNNKSVLIVCAEG